MATDKFAIRIGAKYLGKYGLNDPLGPVVPGHCYSYTAEEAKVLAEQFKGEVVPAPTFDLRTGKLRLNVLEKQVDLWWIADDQAEADQWRKEVEAVGATDIRITPQDAQDAKSLLDFVFRVSVKAALASCGYDVDSLIDNCEFNEAEIAELREVRP